MLCVSRADTTIYFSIVIYMNTCNFKGLQVTFRDYFTLE